MTVRKKYKIILIEPAILVQQGLKTLLSAHPEFEIISTISDYNQYSERAFVHRPDIVIVNPAVLDFHKRNNLRNLFPETALVALLYSYINNDFVRQFDECVDIYDDPARLIRKLKKAVEHTHAEIKSSDNYDLSDREKEILVSVVKGLTNKEIGESHHISVHTVISHRKNITRKTGIKSVSGLTVYALLNNLLDQDEIE